MVLGEEELQQECARLRAAVRNDDVEPARKEDGDVRGRRLERGRRHVLGRGCGGEERGGHGSQECTASAQSSAKAQAHLRRGGTLAARSCEDLCVLPL